MNDDRMAGAAAVVRLDGYDSTEIFGDVPDPFGVGGLGMTWLPKELHFGIRADGRLLAHAGLIVLPMSVGGARVDVVGLGGVAVAADQRGRGLARRVVGAAVEHARSLGPRFAILFCLPVRVGLYERLGWRLLEGDADVLVEQPDGPVVMPLLTMWMPLREGAQWPEGPVRLHSYPM